MAKSGKLFDTSPMQELVGAVINRLFVRYKYRLRAEYEAPLLQVLEEVIVIRGWDLVMMQGLPPRGGV